MKDPKHIHALFGTEVVKNLGRPKVTMPQYESSPGLWQFDDSTGIKFLLWSDGHRKHSYKGSSFEVIVSSKNEKYLCSAFKRLLAHIDPQLFPLDTQLLPSSRSKIKV